MWWLSREHLLQSISLIVASVCLLRWISWYLASLEMSWRNLHCWYYASFSSVNTDKLAREGFKGWGISTWRSPFFYRAKEKFGTSNALRKSCASHFGHSSAQRFNGGKMQLTHLNILDCQYNHIPQKTSKSSFKYKAPLGSGNLVRYRRKWIMLGEIATMTRNSPTSKCI